MKIAIPPALCDLESRVVLVTQDECIFQEHDGKSMIWQESCKKTLKPKGEWALIMVSAFLCQYHELLRLTKDLGSKHPDVTPDSSRIIHLIHPGANRDGYFTNEDLAKQTKNMMMQIFDVLHPGGVALVAFDNNSNHHYHGERRISCKSSQSER
jgi:hypothetical protein